MESQHWVLTIHTNGTISGRSSDGRTFAEPCGSASVARAWMRGFCTAGQMSGWTFEFLEGA